MTTTTPDMSLILPDVSITVGPTWATLLNAALTLIDSHDHSTGKGIKVTPTGLNISSDLTFAQNNATNLRSARLYNNTAITLGVNDKTCLYSLNNELYYVDGAGNNVQVTTGGALNIGTTSALTLNDSSFLLQYFGDSSRKFRFNAASIPVSTTRVLTIPESGADDTLVSQNATQVVKNKTLPDTTTTIGEVSDNTKALKFSLSGATTAKTMTVVSSHTNNRTITIPDTTDTLVGKATTDDLSNKSFTSTTTIKSQNLLTFNNSANTFATSLSAGSNLANVTFKLPIADGSSSQVLQTDGSGQLSFTTAATTTGNVAANDSNVTFTNADNRHQICNPTAPRTYTLPTTSIPAGDTWDFDNRSAFLITLNSSGGNLVGYVAPKNQTRVEALISTPTTAANWNFPVDNTIFDPTDVTKQIIFSSSGNATGITTTIASAASSTSKTLTLPNATDTLVGKATTDVLTNKTLTGNTAVNLISGSGTLTLNTSGTITLPNATDTLVGKATTDVLTNKTLTAPIINGITSGSAPAAGQLGEEISVSQTVSTNMTTTGTFQDLGSILLTAGCWDITGMAVFNLNGSTSTSFQFGIGTVSGNSGVGTVTGINSGNSGPPTATNNVTITIMPFRVNISGNTTYYGKLLASFSAGNPQYVGKLRAVRVG